MVCFQAEEEMSQAITVHGRIQMIENRIQTRGKVAPLFPRDYDTSHLKARKAAAKSSASQAVAAKISAASVALESMGEKLEKMTQQNK